MDDIAKYEEDASIFGNLITGDTLIPVITDILINSFIQYWLKSYHVHVQGTGQVFKYLNVFN